MAKIGARLAFLAGALWVGGVVLMCSPTLAGAHDVSFIAPRRDFAAGVGPFSVAVGDFNGDGKLDLAVANGGRVFFDPGNVTVLINNTGVSSAARNPRR